MAWLKMEVSIGMCLYGVQNAALFLPLLALFWFWPDTGLEISHFLFLVIESIPFSVLLFM